MTDDDGVHGHRRLRRARLATGLLLAAVWLAELIATHVPGERLPSLPTSDILLHFAGYVVLAVLLLAALVTRGHCRPRRDVIAVCVLVAYAAVDELTQPLVRRDAALSDWLADGAGVLAAVVVFEVLATTARMARRHR